MTARSLGRSADRFDRITSSRVATSTVNPSRSKGSAVEPLTGSDEVLAEAALRASLMEEPW
jgi:hypothetical protein